MRSLTRFIAIGLAVASSGWGSQLSGSFLVTPYLQGVTRVSIYVLVESNVPDTLAVLYGTSSAYGRTARTESIRMTTGSTYVHRVRLSGLNPNTVYHYRAAQNADTSSDALFRTAPEPGTPFRFAWFADCRSGTAIHDSIARRVNDAHPLVSLYGGDLASSQSYSAWKNEFFRPDQLALISHVPFYNAPGNHEGWATNTIAFTQTPDTASSAGGYFSIDYGDMHVLVLNTQIPYSQGSPQYVFASKDLSSSTSTWKIVIAHKPAYCAGGHGEDADLKVMTKDLFEPLLVDMVIGGHSHFYQHNLVNGIPHMVLGSAGAPLYDPDSASYTVKSAKDYSYGIVDVLPGLFRMIVYNAGGIPLDSVVLRKVTGVKTGGLMVPGDLYLYPNYPNPFNPVTTIAYDVPKASNVDLSVFDQLGRRIRQEVNGRQDAGHYVVSFLGGRLSSGVYFCRLAAGGTTRVRKLLLLR